MICRLVVILVLVMGTLQAEGVIVSSQFSNYTCLKSAGKDLVIIRGLQSTGTVDSSAPSNIKSANQAGFLTDVYMVVCPGKNATSQVNQMIDYLERNITRKNRLLFQIKEQQINTGVYDSIFDGVYGNIWIDVQTNSALGCSWQTKTAAQNCDYIQQVLKAIEAKGRSAGIFSNAAYWKQIVGENCNNFTKLPVMYNHIDSTASFSDWNTSFQFGGWTAPNVKNYNTEVLVCGKRFSLIYF